MKRAERIVATAFLVTIVSALALFVVYVRGGNTQAEGALLAIALGGVGVGLLVWAKRLMPQIRDETQPRAKAAPATEADLEATVETMESGVEEIRRRRFLSRMLLGAAGALGLAALIPIRSLGRSPGDSLLHTKWTPGAKLVTIDGTPVTASTLEIGSFTTVFPEGHEGSADSQAVLIRVEPGQLQLADDGDGGSAGRARRILEDLHARGLPARPVPRRHARAAMPLPPIDVRRARRREAGLRAGAATVATAADRDRRRRRPDRDRRLLGPRRPELLGAGVIVRRLVDGVDERLDGTSFIRHNLRKVFPDHWSFMLGELALYSFALLLLTGTFLSLFFVASPATTVYQGPYEPLAGTRRVARLRVGAATCRSRCAPGS